MSVLAPPELKPDTAYMEVPSCAACRHWKESTQLPGRGPCGMSMRRDGGLSVFSPDQRPAQVWTRAEFGCVQFEARR